MSGAQLRELRTSLGIAGKALARELGVRPQTVTGTEKTAGMLRPETEAKYLAALTALARRQATERHRALTAELLELAAAD
jgi:transcriptional regulator with XRE-family HTH domain